MAFSKPNARQNRIDLAQVGHAGAIAVLAADGFEASDLTGLASAAERQGYKTVMLSPSKALVSGRAHTGEEMNFVVDAQPGGEPVDGFKGLVIPGGGASLNRLRNDQDARLLVGEFLRRGAPVCAFGDAVDLLAELAEQSEVSADAVLALKGQIFASDGENARTDASNVFIQTLDLDKKAA